MDPFKFSVAFLLFFSQFAFSVESLSNSLSPDGQGAIFDLASGWNVIAAASLIFSLGVILLARVVSEPLSLRELKAWSNIELGQLFFSAIIIASLSVVLFGLDMFLHSAASYNSVSCSPSSSFDCGRQIAKNYLDQLTEDVKKEMSDAVVSAYKYGILAVSRFGLGSKQMLLGQFSISLSPKAASILEVDYYNQVVDEYKPILESLMLQSIFIDKISYVYGPILIVLGLPLRTLFFTRKLGGLLLALGIGFTAIFPSLYVLDSATLAITLYGAAQPEEPKQVSCPLSCLAPAPHYVNSEGSSITKENFSDYVKKGFVFLNEDSPIPKDTDPKKLLEAMDNGTVYVIREPGKTPTAVSSCELSGSSFYSSGSINFGGYNLKVSHRFAPSYMNLYNIDVSPQPCPSQCRRDPYPFEIPSCSDPSTMFKCLALSDICMIKRTTVSLSPLSENTKQILNCQTIRPNHMYNDPVGILPYSSIGTPCDSHSLFVEDTKYNCLNADPECRTTYYYIDDDGAKNLVTVGEDYIKDRFGEDVLYAIKTDPQVSNFFKGFYGSGKDIRVPLIPKGCSFDAELCPVSLNPAESCMFVARYPDEDAQLECGDWWVRTNSTYKFNPSYPDCSSCFVSGGSGFKKTVSPSNFAKSSAGGLLGREEMRNIASFFVPAYLLPLFNVLVTVVAVAGLSEFFGGDVEIPGLRRFL